MSKALPATDIETRLALLNAAGGADTGWSLVKGKLHRKFRFGDFPEAFAFMTQAALVAERMNHHPEWSNVYNRVHVDLITHDAGGLTDLDFELAAAMNRAAD